MLMKRKYKKKEDLIQENGLTILNKIFKKPIKKVEILISLLRNLKDKLNDSASIFKIVIYLSSYQRIKKIENKFEYLFDNDNKIIKFQYLS